MGRKIPGKKHRTVKDPYKQRQKRLENIRLKVNNPPSNADDQEIPRSLLKIVELKNKAKQSVVKKENFMIKRKHKKSHVLSVAKLLDKEPTVKGLTKPNVIIPNLVQKPNESAKSFLGRVSSMSQILINEVEFEEKYGVKINKNLETGEVIEVKKIKNKKKKLAQKRKTKLNQKKENLKNIKDFNQLKDNVEFGEVVHRPPDLSKVKNIECKVQKPKFKSLLLNNVLENTQTKAKGLQSNLEREKRENERRFIVESYRKLKKKI